ncbi:MAG: hypothetical protein QXY87_10715 [Saccharolobus sp.]|uniref:hypothetical protein n=1 Tax=Saccharolobus TaxID=2100760 RepID=UPI001F118B04|nr:hypothetical protein [Saccharolobus shibatae]MCH4816313.1 hypothetical protein [Saccharolobus shibatae]
MVTIVVLELLNFSTVIFLYAKYFDPHSINVFFKGKLFQKQIIDKTAFDVIHWKNVYLRDLTGKSDLAKGNNSKYELKE